MPTCILQGHAHEVSQVHQRQDKTIADNYKSSCRLLTMVHAQLMTLKYYVVQVLAGGHVVQHPSGGQFFAPTVLVNITPDMRIWRCVCMHAWIHSLDVGVS